MTDEVKQAKRSYIERLRGMNPDEVLSRRLNQMEKELDKPQGLTRTDTCRDGSRVEVPICGAPCHYGGTSAIRKYSSANLRQMWVCNQRVKVLGELRYRHRGAA